MSWDDAQAYCKWFSAVTSKAYRLPSEAEWEHACRAGTTTKYSFGNDAKMLGDYAWFSENSRGRTHPVGGKKPNHWGLFDVHGNVWEWCEDALDPFSRAICGGSWNNDPSGLYSSGRIWDSPDNRPRNVSFRMVRVVSPK